MIRRVICFDMDGTIADLYSVDGWLEMLRDDNPAPYREAKPLCNMEQLGEICALLQKVGYEIRVITACSKGACTEYKKAIREAKEEWLSRYDFPYDKLHCIDYTANKNRVMRKTLTESDEAWLIDDEARHRAKWKWGPAVNPTEENIMELLLNLLEREI